MSRKRKVKMGRRWRRGEFRRRKGEEERKHGGQERR